MARRLRAAQSLEWLALLAVIAAGAAFAAYYYMSTLQNAAGSSAAITVESLKAKLIDPTHLQVALVVRNTGSVPVNVTSVKVIYKGTELTCTFEPLPVTLQPGASQPVDGSCTSSTTMKAGDKVVVRVVGESGGKTIPASDTAVIYS